MVVQDCINSMAPPGSADMSHRASNLETRIFHSLVRKTIYPPIEYNDGVDLNAV